ncbi:hypothetical protein, partial [Aphanothece microscopica]|uniref:hypothetical protein n=1 Tax=Aphanothece microscopica TaxID=1049561 RepID=UPI003CE5BF97
MVKMVKAAPANSPTFAACRVEHWDDEKNQPDPLEAEDYEDCDVKEAADRFLCDYGAWRKIQADPAEAQARRAYAEKGAAHLVAIYPNVRISAENYAAAVGEDLAEYSADIVKMVVERTRRTSKTLPTIAVLRDMAANEAERRDKQAAVYRRVTEDHA